MSAVPAVVLTLRFLLELGALVALGWWGRGAADGAASIALAVALPLGAALWWGLWVAPRARRRLRDPWRFAAELVLWIPAALALGDRVGAIYAVMFAVVSLAVAVAARRFEPAASGSTDSEPSDSSTTA